MGETYEANVSHLLYAGPHAVQSDTYEIGVKVEASRGVPWEYTTLRLMSADATFLAHMLQSNQPRPPADDRLLAQVAAHDT
ncbi:MAG TPA: hypothetical protein VJO12_17885 [Stellaceae bacterium]|nr:hypothetical protein [Stellaceae bacterium]